MCLRTPARLERMNHALPKSATIQLVQPSSDTTVLLAAAEQGIKKIYQPGYRLSKAGVMLLDLSPNTLEQQSFFETQQPQQRDMSTLMETMDQINTRWGNRAVCAGSALQASEWQMRQERKSPCYTTDMKWLTCEK